MNEKSEIVRTKVERSNNKPKIARRTLVRRNVKVLRKNFSLNSPMKRIEEKTLWK